MVQSWRPQFCTICSPVVLFPRPQSQAAPRIKSRKALAMLTKSLTVLISWPIFYWFVPFFFFPFFLLTFMTFFLILFKSFMPFWAEYWGNQSCPCCPNCYTPGNNANGQLSQQANFQFAPGGYSHVKTYGDVPQFRGGFLQEIPKFTWVPFFMKKSLTMGLIFNSELQKILKIWCAFVAKSPEMVTFFPEKSLNMGTYFWKKLPPNMGMGLKLPAALPRPIQICVLPLPDNSPSRVSYIHLTFYELSSGYHQWHS